MALLLSSLALAEVLPLRSLPWPPDQSGHPPQWKLDFCTLARLLSCSPSSLLCLCSLPGLQLQHFCASLALSGTTQTTHFSCTSGLFLPPRTYGTLRKYDWFLLSLRTQFEDLNFLSCKMRILISRSWTLLQEADSRKMLHQAAQTAICC